MVKKVVLAYSGGLDTSIMIHWLRENYGCEVIAYAADVGQGLRELDDLRERARAAGASKVYVLDLRREFVEDYIWPTLKAGAVYESRYLLGTSFARPVIAKHQVLLAQKEKADAVAHGATGKGNDQVRFELTFMALDPSLQIIAPWKDPDWTINSREEAIDYAKAHNIPLKITKKRIYSEDANLWHISHEGAELEDPWREPGGAVYSISNTLEKAPARPEYVEIEFRQGVPVALNKKRLPSVDLLRKLNIIGGRHAIGQIDIVENRLVGMKSRGVYETPGGTILYAAHDNLEQLTLDKETYHLKQQLASKYADLVYNGQWFTSAREALDAFVNKTQETVNGTVRLKLYKGNVVSAGVKSPDSLYLENLASFTNSALYDQKDATGFIRCFGLPLKVARLRGRLPA
ncbi:argininosuccinate synthase [Candidatus Termititenax persephonae]|uniref:Argininosuccinate synthase n=1 Tax=Candidatus Termititenax persephonae TaxID=2218525 RepID=A0A388TEA8_9BACT|nr:argininosuccinate synthase [Candidatus Termititenax persephonae]